MEGNSEAMPTLLGRVGDSNRARELQQRLFAYESKRLWIHDDRTH